MIERLVTAARTQMSGDGFRARLIRGGLGSAGIQVINRMLALGLGILLARMLGPEGYGVYAYAFAIMSLLMVAAEAGVPTLLMREVAAAHGTERWGLLRGALRRGFQMVAVVGMGVSLLGLMLLWGLWDTLRFEVFYTAALMLLVLPVAALCKTVAHAMRGLHRIVLGQAVDMLIRPLIVLIIVTLVFLFWPEQRHPHIAMAAQLLGALLVLLAGVMVLRRILPGESHEADPEYKSRKWLKSALPFALIGGVGVINSQTDIIMLGWFLTSEDVGIYRVASQGAILVTFALQAASSVLAPYFSRLYATEGLVGVTSLYKKSTRIIVVSTIPLVVAYVLAGEEILGIVFGQEFVEGGAVLAVLSLGYFFNVCFGAIGLLLQMIGREKIIAYLLLISGFLNIVINLLLIPVLGLIGAAIATAITVVLYHAAFWFVFMRIAKSES